MPKYQGTLVRQQYATYDFEAEDDEAAYDWWMDNWPDLINNGWMLVYDDSWDCEEGPSEV